VSSLARIFAGAFVLSNFVSGCAAPSKPKDSAPPPSSAPSERAPSALSAPPTAEPVGAAPPEKPNGPCEIYIAHYERCEPRLQAEIDTGDRRSARAERAWLEHMRTRPEGVTLADSCAEMLTELQKACP
jgi:hypothetical protein